MTMRPDEYPEGKRPTCACSRRPPVETPLGDWQPRTIVLHNDPHCARCFELFQWEDDPDWRRPEVAGQLGLEL